jgi:hypothetical protein
MKIIITLAALITISFVSSNLIKNSEEICKENEVRVSSNLQKKPQSFILDIKKIKSINMSDRQPDFMGKTFVPLEEVGLVLERTQSSQVLDPIHHKYFRNAEKTVWLPYSHTGEWTRNGNIITNQMKRTSFSNTETPLVTLEFANDKDLETLSDEDLNNILSWLKMNSDKRKIIKTNIKNNILKYQDDYFNNKNTMEKMKTTNTNSQNEINNLTKQIQTNVKVMSQLEITLKTTNKEITTKTTSLNSVNEEMNTLIEKLKILKVELTAQQKALGEFKPTDTKLLEQELNSALVNINLPKNKPERFLEEYSISSQYNYVKSAYDLCIPSRDKWMACYKSIRKSHRLFKK